MLTSSLRYVLMDVCGVAEGRVDYAADDSISTTLSGKQTVAGLVPLVTVLRREEQTPEQQSFLGADAEAVCQINQWLLMAARIAHEALQDSAHRVSCSEHIYGELESAMQLSARKSAYLTGTPHATIADVLLYAAVLSHPRCSCVKPLTVAWTNLMHRDARIQPMHITAGNAPDGSKNASDKADTPQQHKENSPAVAAPIKSTPHKPDKKHNQDRSAYSKPTGEEIELRRKEKERLKAEKMMQKAQQNTTEPANTAKAQQPGSTAPADAVNHATNTAPVSAETAGKKFPSTSAATDVLHTGMLDIRVGRFTNVRRHPNADRLYVENMQLGSETRTIISGIVEHYTIDELEGTLCYVFCNMKPKNMMGVTSHGMIMCASNDTKCCIVRPPTDAQPGDRVVFDATDANPIPTAPHDATASAAIKIPGERKTKELLSHLHTDGQGVACWKDAPARHLATGQTLAVASLPNCTIS